MKKIVIYKKGIAVMAERKIKEAILFRKGWKVYKEEDIKEFNPGKGCLLAIVFLPLVLFGFSKKIKVTYKLN